MGLLLKTPYSEESTEPIILRHFEVLQIVLPFFMEVKTVELKISVNIFLSI